MLKSWNHIFTLVSIFVKNNGNMGFHGNQIGDMVPNLLVKNVPLTFQFEQDGTSLDNSKYDYWILHKKLVWDEIFTIFIKITHISFNIGPRILNLHTLGHPFPSAGHIYANYSPPSPHLPPPPTTVKAVAPLPHPLPHQGAQQAW